MCGLQPFKGETMYWIALILGGFVAVYLVAWIVRGGVNLVLKATGREVKERRATYVAIGIATVLAYTVSGYGFGEMTEPNYSESWIYLVAGILVFLYERRRLAKSAEEDSEADPGEAPGSVPSH